jgi:predicted phage terminase large subunit-like protein
MNDLNSLASLLKPTISKYCPHKPFAKQAAFLMLPHDEALYGGALGGGKSDALLMAALQHVHIPGYSALLIRKTITDLEQKGALLDRMMTWMQPWLAKKEVRYKARNHQFIFPTFDASGQRSLDAVIQFGYIGQSNAFTRYQGIEIQFCGVDECTQHVENDINYLHTRLRKCVCPIHGKDEKTGNPIYEKDCEQCEWARSVPIRFRMTCNPDGIGFAHIKRRYKIHADKTQDQVEQTGVEAKWIGGVPDRPFLPASYKDNPFLDDKDYERRMQKQLAPDMYEALMNGSWGVLANARFKKRWQRFYSMTGNILYLGPNLSGRIINMSTDVQEIFQTIDTATTTLEGPGDVDLFPTRVVNPSWTVISTWMLTKCYNLIFLHMVRFRDEIPEVVDELKEQYAQWKPSVALVEENGVGKGVSQYASRMGMNIEGITADTDKLSNATTAILQMKAGRIWFPQGSPEWVKEAEEEIFTWQGHPKETDDVIDTLSHAANHVNWERAGESEDYFETIETETADSFLPFTVKSQYMYDSM